MTKTTALVIFCDDLRIDDNPALAAACKNHDHIIPLFIYDENYLGRKIGAAAKVFLHHALKSFAKLLHDEYATQLLIKQGDSFLEIAKILNSEKISAIYFNDSYSSKQIEVQQKIKKEFAQVQLESFKAKLLFQPWEIKTSQGENFKVFTPFSKTCLKNISLIGDVVLAPKKIPSYKKFCQNLQIDDLNLLPKNEGHWHLDIADSWSFDYKKISKNLLTFLDKKMPAYQNNRNNAAIDGTTKISPYLRFGMISVRALFYEALRRNHNSQFILEILWREFAYNVFFNNQNIANKELKKNFSAFAWENDKDSLALWQKGKTGFAMVDAGMKELWKTGFMHNRVRMIAASFLTKDLLLDWKKGEEWFWQCLVDADVAVNPFSWQWVFGSGFDAAPYFRIFNPDLQQQRFDPEGEYCKKWLGITIEKYNFPKIVDHKIRREVALARFKEIL